MDCVGGFRRVRKMLRGHHCVSIAAVAVVAAACAPASAPPDRSPEIVTVLRTPNGGIQPQVALDAAGTLHLVYFSGPPNAGDLFYVCQRAGESSYSSPVRVNTQAGSAVSLGTVRGAHIAVGRGSRVHVAWNGSSPAQPGDPWSTPMFYSRLNESGTAFERQRNLITWAAGIDGGGTVAADAGGRVYVAWHAGGDGVEEAGRAVFVARSNDDGDSFSPELAASPQSTGACACCSMASVIDGAANLHLLYRAAARNIDRDLMLLSSNAGGKSFVATPVHRWNINACPLTTSALIAVADGVLAAWETEQQVYFQLFATSGSAVGRPTAPAATGIRRHPVVARNAIGETLLAWTVGSTWGRGGDVEWQVYDPSGGPASAGQVHGLPIWGSLAVVARPDGHFTLWY